MSSRFPALEIAGYRSFYLSQAVSLVGTWMQHLALPWLVYTLTGSPFLLGVVGAAQFLPTLLFSVFAGSLTDRLVKVEAVFSAQLVLALTSALLSVLVFFHAASYPVLLVLAFVLGLANTVDFPARQAMVSELVGRDLVMNAVALNSSLFNAARVVGPAVAGVVMGAWGIGWCFAINALSFVPALLVLSRLPRVAVPKRPQGSSRIWQDSKAGVSYAWNTLPLRGVLVSVALMSILGFNFSVFLPVLVKQTFGRGELELGFLMGCMGVGSVLAALLIAARSAMGPRKSILTWAPFVTGGLLVALAMAPWLGLVQLVMVLVGFSNIAFFTTANSFLQVHSKPEFRGRIMSFYSLLFGGMTPVGSLLAGGLVELGGPSLGFLATGVALFLVFLFWRVRLKGVTDESMAPGPNRLRESRGPTPESPALVPREPRPESDEPPVPRG